MKPTTFHKKIILALMVVIMIAPITITPQPVSAQTSQDAYTVLAPLPCIPSKGATPSQDVVCKNGKDFQLAETVTFKTYVQYTINVVIALSAAAAVLMIVWGGFLYMSTDSFMGKKDGKEYIQNALKGLLLILCSYLILRTIDPRLVAIPNTLVPQLKVVKLNMNNASMQFLQQLESEADKYRVATAESIAAKNKAKADALEILKQMNELSIKYDVARSKGDSQAEVDALAVEWQQLQNKLNDIKADQTFHTYKAVIDGTVNQLTNSHREDGSIDLKDNTPATIQKMMSVVNEAYVKGISSLDGLGDPKNQKTLLTDDYNYAQGELEILKYISADKDAPEKTYASAQSTKRSVEKNIAAIRDPQKKADLQSQFDLIVGKLNTIPETYQYRRP